MGTSQEEGAPARADDASGLPEPPIPPSSSQREVFDDVTAPSNPHSAMIEPDVEEGTEGTNTEVMTILQQEESNETAADVTTTERASSPRAETPTAEALLREWTPNHHRDTVATVEAAATPSTLTSLAIPSPSRAILDELSNNVTGTVPLIMEPPVAPAVVVNEISDSSNGPGGASSSSAARATFPVATFVSHWVRTGVNEIRDQVANHMMYPPGEGEEHPHSTRSIHSTPTRPGLSTTTLDRRHLLGAAASAEGRPLLSVSSALASTSTRSAPPAVLAATAGPMTTALSQQSERDGVATLQSVDVLDNHHHDDASMLDSTTEYVLVDGDLIALPSHGRGRATTADSSRSMSSMGSSIYPPEHMTRADRRRLRRESRRQAQHQRNDDHDDYDGQSLDAAANISRTAAQNMDSIDEQAMEFLNQHDQFLNNSCRPTPTRIRRNFKGVKKWLKKGKKKLLRKGGPSSTNQHRYSGDLSADDGENFTAGEDDILISSTTISSTPSLITTTAAATTTTTTTTPESTLPEDITTSATGASTMSILSSSTTNFSTSERSIISNSDASSPNRKRPAFKRKNKVLSWRRAQQQKQPGQSVSAGARKHDPSVASMPASSAATSASSLMTMESTIHENLDTEPALSRAAPPSANAASLPFPLPPPTIVSDFHTATNSSLGTPNDRFSMAAVSLAPPMGDLSSSQLAMTRTASIAAEASFVGHADQLWGSVDGQGGLLPDSTFAETTYIEDRLDDYDKYDKKVAYGGMPTQSLLHSNADYKVDKMDAPCVDVMLRRANELQDHDDDMDIELSPSPAPTPLSKGKSDGSSVPMGQATSGDSLVHNDTLKVIMVGDASVDKTALARTLRKSTKRSRKKRTTLGVEVHSWSPDPQARVKFSIWDVQGATITTHDTAAESPHRDPSTPDFGSHPGTQSLFFSDNALYLLVWDLAANNPKTFHSVNCRNGRDDDDDDDSDSDTEYAMGHHDNEYVREEATRQADRALQGDIEERVLRWVDCVTRRGSHSAILPVALVPASMSPAEAKRRCDFMQHLLQEHTDRMMALCSGDATLPPPPKILCGAETVLCVSLETNMGMDLLEETILAIAMDDSHSVFDHVNTIVPKGTMSVLEAARRLKKEENKLVLVDRLMAEISEKLSAVEVMSALYFLASVGEVLYFGDMDEVLSQYVILSRKWLVSALSCVLRNDLKRELVETRRFMNMQCLYSEQRFPENHVTQTFTGLTGSNCPLLSSCDTQMLWQSMSFMREAADQTEELLSENPTTASTMFSFLEHLLVHTGVFMPINFDRFASDDNVFFVPSLLSQADSRDIWTFKSSEAWMTTLSHSWLFRDGAPDGLMEQVTVGLLQDLYEFSHIVIPATKPQCLTPTARSSTFPFGRNSMTDFLDSHIGESIGHIKIHQVMCWKSSLLMKIGCVFPDGDELTQSFVEIFIAIADETSPHCVASDAMRSNMHRLVVSGKGQVGHHGRKLWKGGYGVVLDSIKASVAHCTNVDRQVVCPECLAHSHPSNASTWSWDSVRAAASSGSSVVRCMRGHRVDSSLICGTAKPSVSKSEGQSTGGEQPLHPPKPIKDLLPAVVVVGLWDAEAKAVHNIGSGFMLKGGLVVTAGHILFDMTEGRNFGIPYFGLRHAKAVIGVIPGGQNMSTDRAVFRYFAEIVAEDIHNMDACVLKILTRMEKDVEGDAQLDTEAETLFDAAAEQLPTLKMTSKYELEESVRILGFNQGGEGILEQGKHVNRSADFARGYICKQFKMTADDSSSSGDDDDDSCSEHGFTPREEIVVMCPTISGHSGGPCVNDDGKVVGILSRADPVDRQRCYLVPVTELRSLVKKGKNSSVRSGGLKMY